MSTAFKSWRRSKPAAAASRKAALKSASPTSRGLSRDVTDIVQRALADSAYATVYVRAHHDSARCWSRARLNVLN